MYPSTKLGILLPLPRNQTIAMFGLVRTELLKHDIPIMIESLFPRKSQIVQELSLFRRDCDSSRADISAPFRQETSFTFVVRVRNVTVVISLLEALQLLVALLERFLGLLGRTARARVLLAPQCHRTGSGEGFSLARRLISSGIALVHGRNRPGKGGEMIRLNDEVANLASQGGGVFEILSQKGDHAVFAVRALAGLQAHEVRFGHNCVAKPTFRRLRRLRQWKRRSVRHCRAGLGLGGWWGLGIGQYGN